jgi:hypothetical protein
MSIPPLDNRSDEKASYNGREALLSNRSPRAGIRNRIDLEEPQKLKAK